MTNLTVSVDEEALGWARRKAADEHTSVSKLVGKMLREKMLESDDYGQAFERWKVLSAQSFEGVDASRTPDREARNARR